MILDDDEEDYEEGLQEVYPIEYRQLKKLDLSSHGWWIPGKAPMLEELRISAYTIWENVAVLDTIPSTLRKLELGLDENLDLGHIGSVEHYLHGLAQQSQFNQLLIHFYNLSDIQSILNAIHRLDQLQHLMISFKTKWDYSQMERFIAGLGQGCPKLICLEIQCLNAPSIYFLNALKQLEYLKRFGFSINGMGGNDGFWRAIQSISQLMCIRIYPASAANMDDIRRLQEQRPDLKIILDRRFTRFEDPLQTIQ